MIFFKKVNAKDKIHIKLLFEMLNKREYSISHDKIITFEKHIIFVKTNPYRNWFLIYQDKEIIGSIYSTYENYLGINLVIHQKELYKEIIIKFISKIKPLKPKSSIRNKNFSINVPFGNFILEEALIELKASFVQKTYIL